MSRYGVMQYCTDDDDDDDDSGGVEVTRILATVIHSMHVWVVVRQACRHAGRPAASYL